MYYDLLQIDLKISDYIVSLKYFYDLGDTFLSKLICDQNLSYIKNDATNKKK